VKAVAAPGQAVSVARVADDRVTREHAIGQVGQAFAAQGVTLGADGTVVLQSQDTGGQISQRTVAAAVKTPQGSRVLPRAASPQVAVSNAPGKGSLTYRDAFQGLDVEYTYDGKDVEELVHVGQAVRDEVVAGGGWLEVVSVFPGLTTKNAHVVGPGVPEPGLNTTPGEAATWGATRELELLVDGRHRFALPPAVAFDEAGKRSTLLRHLDWTPEGMTLAVRLDAAWLKTATGKVVIDPSIIDGPRRIELHTWSGPNAVVKDDAGVIHIVARVVYNGAWTAVYYRGTAAGWSQAYPIAAHTSGESTHYQPGITRDSTNRLHVIYADYGSGYPGERGIEDARHRVKYAYCDNGCPTGDWQGQTFLLPGTGSDQYLYSIAAGAGNEVAVTFYDNRSRISFMVRDPATGTWSQKTDVVAAGTSRSQVLAATDGRFHVLAYAHNPGTPSDGRVYYRVWDGSAWLARPDLIPRAPGDYTCRRQEALNAVMDSDDNVHLALSNYSEPGCGGTGFYAVSYARYDTSDGTWKEQARPTGETLPTMQSEELPTITVENSGSRMVRLFYQKALGPYRIVYTEKSRGGAAWSTPVVLFPYSSSTNNPHVVHATHAPSYSLEEGYFDLVFLDDGNILKYFTNKSLLDPPVLLFPENHAYTQDTTPEFTWRRVGSDTFEQGRPNLTYQFQLCNDSLFQSIRVEKTGLTAPQVTLSGAGLENLDPNKFYYWRVRAVLDVNGASSPWSKIFEVSVDQTPPTVFDLVAPVNNSDPGTRTPRFTWNPSTN
jgi:hypothetical protein